jgi:MFS family permease
VGFNIANVGPAAEVVSRAYGVHLGTVGFLTTAFVTHLAMQIPGGKLVDQRGARNLGMVALAVILLGNILALLVDSFALGLVGRLIAGIGTGVGFIAGSDYIRATVGTARAQGLYGAAGVGGGGLAIAVVPLAKNIALCGLRLDGFHALLVQGRIACSVGSGSEKSVYDARSVNASAAPLTPHVPKLLL